MLAFAAVCIGEIPSDPSFLTDRAKKLAQFELNIWVILDLIDKLHQVRLGWYSLEDSEGIQMCEITDLGLQPNITNSCYTRGVEYFHCNPTCKMALEDTLSATEQQSWCIPLVRWQNL